ncbi:hypothetical protein LAZ67_9003354 [Cordylochernes scorpioides]|uniref:Uncharacterized protein n=1 Tax=Cordylochernes scorpioides TaxID=51811 RepID=A0ABY6KUG2_9ARAC|nr:hypothetical protein LAZ67_9003354 [Cordylochernes scorpioides]
MDPDSCKSTTPPASASNQKGALEHFLEPSSSRLPGPPASPTGLRQGFSPHQGAVSLTSPASSTPAMTPPLPDLRIPCHQFAFCSHVGARRPYLIGQLARNTKTSTLQKTGSTPITTVSMPRRKMCAHYEHMSEFERGRSIGLKEAGWSNRLIARHLCRSDAAIRRC